MRIKDRKPKNKVVLSTTENSSKVGEYISKSKKHEKEKVALKIRNGHYILVDPENCNEQYRQEYIKKLNEYSKIGW